MTRTKYQIIEVNQIEVTVDLSMLVKTDVSYQDRKDQLTKYYQEKILLPA